MHIVTYDGLIGLSLFLTTLLLELELSHVHDGGSDLVDVRSLLFSEVQDLESNLKVGGGVK